MNNRRLLTAYQAADCFTSISTGEVVALARNGEIPAVRHGSHYLFDERALENWMETSDHTAAVRERLQNEHIELMVAYELSHDHELEEPSLPPVDFVNRMERLEALIGAADASGVR